MKIRTLNIEETKLYIKGKLNENELKEQIKARNFFIKTDKEKVLILDNIIRIKGVNKTREEWYKLTYTELTKDFGKEIIEVIDSFKLEDREKIKAHKLQLKKDKEEQLKLHTYEQEVKVNLMEMVHLMHYEDHVYTYNLETINEKYIKTYGIKTFKDHERFITQGYIRECKIASNNIRFKDIEGL